jgi:Sodium:neurotransmitter symporter family
MHGTLQGRVFLLLSQAVLIFNLVSFSPLEFNDVVAPAWCQALGWLMTISPIVIIIVVAAYKLTIHLKKANVERLSCCQVIAMLMLQQQMARKMKLLEIFLTLCREIFSVLCTSTIHV